MKSKNNRSNACTFFRKRKKERSPTYYLVFPKQLYNFQTTKTTVLFCRSTVVNNQILHNLHTPFSSTNRPDMINACDNGVKSKPLSFSSTKKAHTVTVIKFILCSVLTACSARETLNKTRDCAMTATNHHLDTSSPFSARFSWLLRRVIFRSFSRTGERFSPILDPLGHMHRVR